MTIVSHDLKQPLQVIIGFAETLFKYHLESLNQEAVECLTYIVKAGTRMTKLIDDLLAFSSIKARKLDLKPVDCNQILERVLEDLQLAIAQKQASVISPNSLPTVSADKTLLAELFQNLIANGIKFCSPGQLPQVEISAVEKDKEWIFAVRDNGIGIDPEQFERVFQMFQRLHSREEYPGTGIGLATCKKIVEHHGGRIWVESRPNEGTSFFFTVPISIR